MPVAVTYCHCADCRRVTGAPVAAFAAFPEADLAFVPNAGRKITATPGVMRTFCGSCGSPLAGHYDYLPGMIYVPLGLIDQAASFPPEMHAHAENRLPWLQIDDALEQYPGSARVCLNQQVSRPDP
jgi:hypothetical protein